MIRRAVVADVPMIGKIINDCAEYGLMLPRSLASLYENLRDFQVAIERDESGEEQVAGVCGLSVIWANLAEVYALAVSPSWRGRGLGKALVLACVDEAAALGVRKLMTLTYEQAFFEKLGFGVVDRQKLPLKVWSECLRCPKNHACDEIAMIRELPQVPQLDVPRPSVPAPDAYVMPVTLTTFGRARLPGSQEQERE